jgi:hypothetical protein
MNRVFVFHFQRRPDRVYGPEPKPYSLRLMELADDLQDKLTEWDYKQLADLAHEKFLEEQEQKRG